MIKVFVRKSGKVWGSHRIGLYTRGIRKKDAIFLRQVLLVLEGELSRVYPRFEGHLFHFDGTETVKAEPSPLTVNRKLKLRDVSTLYFKTFWPISFKSKWLFKGI